MSNVSVTTPATLSVSWYTEVLRATGVLPSGNVVSVEANPCGTGQLADSYRLTLTYDLPDLDAPKTLIAKLPSSDQGSRMMALAAGVYEREALFYRDVAPSLAIKTPLAYFAGSAPNGVDIILLLEDLAPAAEVDQVTGCAPERAALALSQAAGLHGSSWKLAELDKLDWLHGGVKILDYMAGGLPDKIGAFRERYGLVLEPEFMEVAEQVAQIAGRWAATLHEPRCILHCDFRLDNMLFDAQNGAIPIAVFDWQSAMLAPGIIDASYFLGAGLEVEDRRTHEESLMRGYHKTLLSHGVEDYPWEQCWAEYKMHAVAGFFTVVNASVQVEQTERGDQMFMTMARRHGAHIIDSDSISLLRNI